jgi:Zn-dependent protease
MKGSWRMARVAGVDINLHWSFSLVILWVLLHGAMGRRELANIVFILAAVLLLFACVMLHELGHALMARWLRVEVQSITLLPIGGLARIQAVPEQPLYELLITAAGPLANLALVAALLPLFFVLDERLLLLDFIASPATIMDMVMQSAFQEGAWAGLMVFLLLANSTLFFFNLIPAFPMDGGRILRAVLALGLSPAAATQIAIAVGQIIGLLLVVGAVWLRNPGLLLVAVLCY